MKLTINQNQAIEETEIIINCPAMEPRIRQLADYIRQYSVVLEGEMEGAVYYVPLETVIYIDSVDKHTFFYDRYRIFGCKSTLAQLEERLKNTHFIRISKNCIINLALVQCMRSGPDHRLELTMVNGEHLPAGRAYQKQLKQSLAQLHTSCLVREEKGMVEQEGQLAYFEERAVRNAGRIICFSGAPQRIAALSYGVAELLCALGQEGRLVAISPAEETAANVPVSCRAQLEKVPLLKYCGDGVPTVEALEGMEAQLVVCSWYFAKMQECKSSDAATAFYIMESTMPEKAGMEQLYRDILNLGRILRAENLAIALVEQTRRRIAALTRRIERRRPVKVFIYDGGESSPVTSMAGTLENDLVLLAGGSNLFGGCKGSYSHVSWQQAAQEDPEVIIIHDYPDSLSTEEKIACLKSQPLMRRTTAVCRESFVILPLLDVFPGIRTAEVVEKLIRAFHPDAL